MVRNRHRKERLRAGNTRRSRVVWLVYLFLVGLGASFFFLIQFLWSLFTLRVEAGPTKADVLALWNQGAYSDVIANLNTELDENPLDPTQLVLLGFSHFYQALGYGDALDQRADMDLAVVYLRKALLFDSTPARDRVYYVLGKSYYHKGYYYSDLATEYLLKALNENSHLENGYEYLGLAYNLRNDHEKSFTAFQKAYAQRPTALLLYAMAEQSFGAGDLMPAREYLMRLQGDYETRGDLAGKPDDNLMQKVWLLLGDLSFKEARYTDSESFFDRVVKINPSNALVYLKLGDVYDMRDKDVAKARKAWRTAVELDPYLELARERLKRPIN